MTPFLLLVTQKLVIDKNKPQIPTTAAKNNAAGEPSLALCMSQQQAGGRVARCRVCPSPYQSSARHTNILLLLLQDTGTTLKHLLAPTAGLSKHILLTFLNTVIFLEYVCHIARTSSITLMVSKWSSHFSANLCKHFTQQIKGSNHSFALGTGDAVS